MPRSNHPGYLIAFEGIDGVGKSTQAHMAAKELADQGHETHVFHEPSRGVHGLRLRELLSAPQRPSPMDEMQLFLKDRADDVERNIRPALKRGAVVFMDRYYISSMAYQGALGLDIEMIRRENEAIAPQPDLTLIFRLPVHDAQNRIAAGRPDGPNQFELRTYQEHVSEILESLEFPNLVRIDASKNADQIHGTVMAEIRKHLADL